MTVILFDSSLYISVIVLLRDFLTSSVKVVGFLVLAAFSERASRITVSSLIGIWFIRRFFITLWSRPMGTSSPTTSPTSEG